RGSLVFELTGALRRTDIASAGLLVPPSTASFSPGPLSPPGVIPMLTAQELAALRTNDIDVPSDPNDGDALVVANPTVALRILYLDGVPVASASPGAHAEVVGLHRGRYVAQWRTFLGDAVEPPVTQTVPGIAQIGAILDAGR
ncbi:MAG TPA: hypothetical protein VM580_27690, partial [Labilithrix sp.]|nr:hypothetical protein [Labilithrix sp.]